MLEQDQEGKIKNKIYFIYNCFFSEKIKNYKKKYQEILNEIEHNIYLSNHKNTLKEIIFYN